MDENINKKQNRKMTVFAIVLSLISVGILVFGFFLVSSNKVVMLQSISNLTAKLNTVVDNNTLINKIASNNDIGVRSDITFCFDTLHYNGKINLDYLENRGDQKSSLSMKMMMSNDEQLDQKLFDAKVALQDRKIYFFVDEITPQYYQTVMDYYSIFSKLNSDDYDNIVSLLKQSVNSSIDNKDIKKEKETIPYHGKNKKVNKLTYVISKNTIYDIMNNLFTSIQKDKTLMNHLSSFMNMGHDEIIQYFDKELQKVKNSDFDDELHYHVYYYGFNKIIAYELTDQNNSFQIQYKIDRKEMIDLYVNQEVFLHVENEKKKDSNHFDGYIVLGDQIHFKGTYHNDDQLNLMIQDQYTIHLNKKEYEENNKYHSEITIDLIIGKDNFSSITMNTEYYFNEKVNGDIQNSIDVNNLSEEDRKTILENLEKHPLYRLINDLDLSMNL